MSSWSIVINNTRLQSSVLHFCVVCVCHYHSDCVVRFPLLHAITPGHLSSTQVTAMIDWLIYLFITSAEEGGYVFSSVCLSVCLYVCPSDYSQTCERILTKFFGGVGHGARTKWYNFGGDPDHASDLGVQSPKSGSSGSVEVCAVWAYLVYLLIYLFIYLFIYSFIHWPF